MIKMLLEFQDDNVRSEVYRGMLVLVLKQAVSVYWEAAKLKVDLDIHQIQNKRLCSVGAEVTAC